MSFLSKFVRDDNQKKLNEIQPLVDQINQLEEKIKLLSDEELKQKSLQLKEKVQQELANQKEERDEQGNILFNNSALDKVLPEAFALVRESAKRTLGQRHFDVQLIGGIALHWGEIAEMKTGEGKTLAATLAIYLNALAGRGTHVITVNDYLSRRDVNWMGPVYDLLGLSCACINHDQAYLFNPQTEPDENEVTVEMQNLRKVERKQAYQADITYGTNNEFGFDYLRDNMAPSLETMVQRDPFFAIIDEVDSVLIDEARTPLIISAPDADSGKMYQQFSSLVPQLKENQDYNIDEKARAVTLTEAGISKVEKILGMENIYQEGGIRYVHHLEQALRAEALFKKDRDYVVRDNQVIIVDEFTGRLMPGRRYSDGLHQALEAKENVQVQQESRTVASITFQNYFRMYPKLAGMTGTALTSAEEFHKVYQLEITVVPTNKPMIRQDLSDVIYKTEKAKFKAIVEDVKQRNQKGQPVLIGTVSIEKNELLAEYLKRAGVPHQILNAKNHEQEAQIISQAGKKSAVTVATNMAGRGVDIILGGRPEDYSAEEWQKIHQQVIDLGGLHVIGTERHEARRIDDQLRGRAGRQGDPGSSQFYASLEDDLMRIFGGDRVSSLMNTLRVPEDQPIENKMISRAIESAQSKIEGHNFDIRKHVLEYDDVLNKQRDTIYRRRKEVLKEKNLKPEFLEMLENQIRDAVELHTQAQPWNLKEISEISQSMFSISNNLEEKLKEFKNPEKVSEYLIELAKQAYQEKEKEINQAQDLGEKELKPEQMPMRQVERFVLLRSIDSLWMDHIDNMSHLRDSVRLRAYGQKDPLVEYKNEGMRLFQQLLGSIQSTAVNMIFKIGLAPAEQQSRQSNQIVDSGQNKVGRNDPCPCGSGKKFKKCHGK